MTIPKFANKNLGDIVLSTLAKVALETDKSLKTFGKDEAGTRLLISSLAYLKTNTLSSVGISFNPFFGMGYDFAQSGAGLSPEEAYKKQLAIIKAIPETFTSEKFIAEGIVDNRYGWYVTSTRLFKK